MEPEQGESTTIDNLSEVQISAVSPLMTDVVDQLDQTRTSWFETSQRPPTYLNMVEDTNAQGQIATALAASTIDHFCRNAHTYEKVREGTTEEFANYHSALVDTIRLEDIDIGMN
ncbi:hypothetical protein L486_08233 [Kwoniella mangroviensis CBS 10435]|uniref:Uncharacterized protein n=1 Tax=Kwoniella mangroviensis CBS 10435 TaxID=1331196 RepID=A0A1B9IF95_9TREE|nr:hypothetical protein L486_08233 [Kwoniella mangroviensis CBS 10435]